MYYVQEVMNLELCVFCVLQDGVFAKSAFGGIKKALAVQDKISNKGGRLFIHAAYGWSILPGYFKIKVSSGIY